MAQIKFNNSKIIGDFQDPYVIAELNTSHFGNIEIAKEMIDRAIDAGCNCVKFQSWSANTLYSEKYFTENKIAKRVFDKFALTENELKALSIYSRERQVDFASTPYSIDEAKFLIEECGVPFIKIASMELNNLPYLKQLGSLNFPLVLSTGMGTLEEIKSAVKTVKDNGCNSLAVLHCNATYPADIHEINLNNIITLRSELGNVPIGYSDHTLGLAAPVASVALGACIIEKHFTLDSERIGMDNQMATEPKEMTEMILACREAHNALGNHERKLSKSEFEQRSKMRRSIIAKHELNKGDVITLGSLGYKRPGDGLSPEIASSLIGRKILSDKISKGDLIRISDLEK